MIFGINDKVVTNRRIILAFVAKRTISRVYIRNFYMKSLSRSFNFL